MAQDKEIVITVFDDDATVQVDLQNFHGTGCADVQKAFKELGKVTLDRKKPEFLKRGSSVISNNVKR